jgi:hypothetical protein
MSLLDHAVSSGVIDLDKHQPLLDDRIHLCERAGIEPDFMLLPMDESVPPEVKAYVQTYRRLTREGINGCAITGSMKGLTPMLSRMVGSYMRNFVDANLCSLETALTSGWRHRSVLMIPDFWLRTRSEHVQGQMLSLMMEREGKQTVVAVADIKACINNCGPVMKDLLEGYHVVKR